MTSSSTPELGVAVLSREPADRDEDLVGRARLGDLGAFETLVERHQDVVRRVAARIVGDNDASDVAQDAFLRAFHRLDRFRGEAPFRTWLLRITHNSALDTLARRHDHASVRPEDEPFAVVLNSPAIRPPADQLEVAERHQRLTSKLQAMPEQHRAVLVLRDLEGLSYEEIADITEAPLGSVKGRLHRARKEMISLLRTNTYDWGLQMTDADTLEHGTPVERRLGEVLADVGANDRPTDSRFAPTLARKAKNQLLLRHALHPLIAIAEAAPRTIATLTGGSRANDRQSDHE